MLMQICFLILTLFLFSNSVSAAKLYKIVDEKGKVTFSQFPPDEIDENKIVENVVLSQEHKAAKLKVKVYGENEYCGDLLLTDWTYKGKSSDAYKISHLEKRIERWKKQIVEQEQYIQNLTQNQFDTSTRKKDYETDKHRNQRYQQYSDRQNKYLESLKKYRCAVSWGSGKLDGNYGRESINDMNKEVKRLRGVLTALESKRDRNCGKKPVFDPSQEHLKYQYEQWENCNRSYTKDIKKVKRQITNISLTAN